MRLLEADGRVGCVIEGPEVRWVVLMRKDHQRPADPVELMLPGEHPCRVLITDLKSGLWHARRQGSADTRDLVVGEDSGAAWFEGSPGAWTFSP